MPNKIFDLILRSKFTPTGVKGAVAGLKSIGEAGFFIQRGILGPLGMAAGAVGDLIGKANPQRIKEFGSAFDNLGKSVGILLDGALGPLIDILGGVVKGIADVINAFNEVTGAAAAYRAELDRVYRSQKLISDFAKGLVEGLSDAGALLKGQKDLLETIARTQKTSDEARADSAQQRARLILDIARKEADRLEDIARQNARQMQDIDAQRTEALTRARDQYGQAIANIDTQTAQRRIDIESDFQEKMRQIKNQSDEDIEEAIRRRDARALSKAMNARTEQVGQARRCAQRRQQIEMAAARINHIGVGQPEFPQHVAQDSLGQQLEVERSTAQRPGRTLG